MKVRDLIRQTIIEATRPGQSAEDVARELMVKLEAYIPDVLDRELESEVSPGAK